MGTLTNIFLCFFFFTQIYLLLTVSPKIVVHTQSIYFQVHAIIKNECGPVFKPASLTFSDMDMAIYKVVPLKQALIIMYCANTTYVHEVYVSQFATLR